MTSADPSNLTPVKKRAYNAQRPCSAHSSRTGEPCRKPAVPGANVCTVHGGRAPAVKAKARKRIEEAADRLARQLLGIAEGAESEAVRLAAVKDALDRAGVQAKTAAAVEVSVKPFEMVFSHIAAGPRDPQPALPAGESEIVAHDTDKLGALDVEAEVIDAAAGDPSLGLEYTDADVLERDDDDGDHERVSGTHLPTRGSFVAQRGRWAGIRERGVRPWWAAGASRAGRRRNDDVE